MEPSLKERIFEWIEKAVTEAENPEQFFETLVEVVLDMDGELAMDGVTWLDRIYASRVNQE